MIIENIEIIQQIIFNLLPPTIIMILIYIIFIRLLFLTVKEIKSKNPQTDRKITQKKEGIIVKIKTKNGNVCDHVIIDTSESKKSLNIFTTPTVNVRMCNIEPKDYQKLYLIDVLGSQEKINNSVFIKMKASKIPKNFLFYIASNIIIDYLSNKFSNHLETNRIVLKANNSGNKFINELYSDIKLQARNIKILINHSQC